MLPMKALREQLGTALAADLPLAGAGATNKVRLLIADFTPNENMTFAQLVSADFDGSTPLAAALGTQQVGLDPLTGEQIVTMIEPLGGWRWITTGLTNLPQTVFGYALVDELAGTVLLGLTHLDVPVTLSIVGQEVRIPSVQFTLSQQPIS